MLRCSHKQALPRRRDLVPFYHKAEMHNDETKLMSTRRGFTLLELLVVLTIMALVFVIAMPRFGFVSPQTEVKSGARDVAAALREARSRAIVSNSEVQFNLDVERHHFAISGDDQLHPLPGDIKLLLYTAQEEQGGQATGAIRFFPDGSSTGGYVSLSAAKSSYDVTVDWLTGRVEIRSGEKAGN